MDLPPKHVRFTHTPLNYRNMEIRLVKIEPTTDPSSPIHITIKNLDFGKNSAGLRLPSAGGTINFIALSYTWGPEFPVQEVFVTSPECRGWLSVRQNLYDFLKIRRDCETAWFWIDQICINQGKDDEKTHQVNQMADIYRWAAVEVWLGSGFEGSDSFMDMMVQQTSRLPNDQSWFYPLGAVQLGWRRSFLRLPYWSRLWVLQEIALGNTVTIRIGSKTISWNNFYTGWESFDGIAGDLAITQTDDDLEHISARIRCIHDRRLKIYGSSSWWGISMLIQGAECSDPRDRVFGALGMVDPWLRLLPDYSKQPQGILLQLLNKELGYRSRGMDTAWYPSWMCARERRAIVNTAKWWLLALDDDKNLIDPKFVRRHLLEALPLDPPVFRCKFARTLQLKCYIWKAIPNNWSLPSRLAHAGVQRVEPLARILIELWSYAKEPWEERKFWNVEGNPEFPSKSLSKSPVAVAPYDIIGNALDLQ